MTSILPFLADIDRLNIYLFFLSLHRRDVFLYLDSAEPTILSLFIQFVRLLEVFRDEENFLLVTELCDGVDMIDEMETR